MTVIKWQKNYSVEVRELDRQHRRIVELVNQLHALNQETTTPPEALQEVFDTVRDYIQQHFAYEEELMRSTGYVGYAEQKREHERFIDSVCAWQKDILKGRTVPLINVFNTLWDWFAHHILEVDGKYKPHFRKQGYR